MKTNCFLVLLCLVATSASAHLGYQDTCTSLSSAIGSQTSIGVLCPKHLKFDFSSAQAQEVSTFRYRAAGRVRHGVYLLSDGRGATSAVAPDLFTGTDENSVCYLERSQTTTDAKLVQDYLETEPLFVHQAPRIGVLVRSQPESDQYVQHWTTVSLYLGSKEEVLAGRNQGTANVQKKARYILRCTSRKMTCHKSQCLIDGLPASGQVTAQNYFEYPEIKFTVQELAGLLGGVGIEVQLDADAYTDRERRE